MTTTTTFGRSGAGRRGARRLLAGAAAMTTTAVSGGEGERSDRLREVMASSSARPAATRNRTLVAFRLTPLAGSAIRLTVSAP